MGTSTHESWLFEAPAPGKAGAAATRAALPLERELDGALQREDIGAHYQPQFELATGCGCGIEALARWVRANGQAVSPTVFVPLAERMGAIHALGALMLRSAIRTAKSLWRHECGHLTLSVNVSPLQINEGFTAVVADSLRRYGFPPRQLQLEITESALIAHPERTIAYLKEWKTMGVRIAIDDFGAGYSNLNYLTRMPLDGLKIDRSLVQRVVVDAKGAAIMKLILAMAAELELDVVAEGIETELELQTLMDLKCARGQGFLLCRPVPARQAQVVLLKNWGNRRYVPQPADTDVGVAHAA